MTTLDIKKKIEERVEDFEGNFVVTLSPTGIRATQADYESIESWLLMSLSSLAREILEEVEREMQKDFTERRDELNNVPHNAKTRAFIVAGIDLIYNYKGRILSHLEALKKTL